MAKTEIGPSLATAYVFLLFLSPSSSFLLINILLSQLNRNIEQEHRAKNQYQPLLTDLFGGDSIGQDAHVVMILNRPYDLYGITNEYCGEDPQGLLACHMEKNRDGLLGMIGYEGTHDIHLLITGFDITGENAFK